MHVFSGENEYNFYTFLFKKSRENPLIGNIIMLAGKTNLENRNHENKQGKIGRWIAMDRIRPCGVPCSTEPAQEGSDQAAALRSRFAENCRKSRGRGR